MDRSRDFFYPVAVSDQIGSAPIAASLLGERLALVRLGGELVAFRDLCVHRGTPLSMGRVEGDLLVCAYHGWNYDRDGACVRIPQRGPEHPIPRKARVERFRAEERYGAVWVCLGDPSVPLPGYPEYDDPAFRTVFVGVHEWEAGAARMMENFLDVGHFAWVHPGLLGDEERPEVSVSPIVALDDGFTYRAETEMLSATGEWSHEPVDYTYTFPYNFRITRERERIVSDSELAEGQLPKYVLTICIQPIGPRRSRRYTWVSRNYALDSSNDVRFTDALLTLAEQDRTIVEAQRPEELPLDIAAEMHIKAVDAPAVQFRRVLATVGLEESADAVGLGEPR